MAILIPIVIILIFILFIVHKKIEAEYKKKNLISHINLMLSFGILIKNYKPKYFYFDLIRILVSFTAIFIEIFYNNLLFIYLVIIICLSIYFFK
jgi:hypothetical protein